MNENGHTPIVGGSRAILELIALGQRVARTDLPILIVGQTGTGKELFAQHVHQWSGRPGALVAINCAALPDHLVESELFGHDGQAYTGARHAKPGLLEIADGGTLLLDEVASLPLGHQAKLLRVLETGEVWRVGETKARRINVRCVAAAQDDLSERVSDGRFRSDLLQRLAGVVLRIPPLVERLEDIMALATHFATQNGRTLGSATERLLTNYEWPGNVRELKLALHRASHLGPDGVITAMALSEAIDLGAPALPGRGGVAEPMTPARRVGLSRADLLQLCAAHEWQAESLAQSLGIGKSTVYRWLSADGIDLRALRFSHLSLGIPGTREKMGRAAVAVRG